METDSKDERMDDNEGRAIPTKRPRSEAATKDLADDIAKRLVRGVVKEACCVRHVFCRGALARTGTCESHCCERRAPFWSVARAVDLVVLTV
jgi:hypothetical protein